MLKNKMLLKDHKLFKTFSYIHNTHASHSKAFASSQSHRIELLPAILCIHRISSHIASACTTAIIHDHLPACAIAREYMENNGECAQKTPHRTALQILLRSSIILLCKHVNAKCKKRIIEGRRT